jgi:hypothetical protein
VLYGMLLSRLRLFRGEGLAVWAGLVVAGTEFRQILNSHLFDFHEGWIYVLGVGVAGGMSRGSKSAKTQKPDLGLLTRTLKPPTVGSASEPATACERSIHAAADR